MITTFMLAFAIVNASSQNAPGKMVVAAYYTGDGININTYSIGKLTHIIYSFLHLKGNRLAVDNMNDSLAITRLVALKANYPDLKIILSLGGWGGCQSCSEVFNTASGRLEFAQSVLQLMKSYRTDGIDLDWEYPVLESLPGPAFLLAANWAIRRRSPRARRITSSVSPILSSRRRRASSTR